MANPDLVQRAAEQVAAALHATGPADRDAPTPCRDWDLRTLVNHFGGTSAAMGALGRGESLDPDDPWGGRTDIPREDWPVELADRVHAVGTAWSADGPWQHPHSTGGQDMPGQMLGDMAFIEILLHGWDVVTAAGGHLDVDDEVGAEAYRSVAETADLGRQMGAYADAVPVQETAPAFHRALGASGRDPGWSPPAAGAATG